MGGQTGNSSDIKERGEMSQPKPWEHLRTREIPQSRRILRGNKPDVNSMTRPRLSQHAMSRKAGDQAVSSKTPAQ
ncbi:Alpha-galactosidase 2 [Fusarium oxysporum f. sp. albedinis]|nr:Alpha-galactosidase 2 [Fusarium oxysporum f. sp. albedinis]